MWENAMASSNMNGNPMHWPRCHVSLLAFAKFSELVEGVPCEGHSEEGRKRRREIG